MLKYFPAVFAVGNTYQIMVLVKKPSLMWVEIGSDFDSYKVQPCTVVTAAHLDGSSFAGCGFAFNEDSIDVRGVSDKGDILIDESIKRELKNQ